MADDAEQLRAFAERYRPILEDGPVGVFEVQRNGIIRYVNPALARTAGYASTQEMVGRDINQHYVDPEQRRRLWQEVATHGSVTGFPVTLTTQSGEERRLILAMSVEGEFARGVCVDVTQLHLKERELEAALELNRRIFEAIPGGVVHVRKDGSIAMANSEAVRVLGLAYDELTRRYTADFEAVTIHEDGSPCSNEHYPVTQALRSGKAQPPHTIGVRRADGETSWAVFRAVPVMEPGTEEVAGAVVTFIDISERKRAERALQQAQKLESLGLLAGGVAHDFNNLLAAILGNAGLIRMRLGGAHRVAENLDALESAVQRAADLTRQMLAYAGHGRVEPRATDVNAVVNDVTGLISSVISKKAELCLELDEHLPAVQADRSQLDQVLMNLVLNASDALGSLGGRIRIRTSLVELSTEDLARSYVDDELDAGSYVLLEVSDTGVGMDAKTRARVFDPFYSTKATGRGLGLAATLGIVRSHMGALNLQSSPGKGTTFSVYLPASTESAEAQPDKSEMSEPRLGTVLVIDDEDALRITTCRLLEQLGYSTLSASGGRSGLAMLEAHRDEVAVVLLDLTMPDVSGADILTDLLRIAPACRVVIASGYSEEDVARLLAGLPHGGFLQKPYTPTELGNAIEGARDGGPTA
ncbi:MAG: PAS domain S-box protein [Polyangiaceae bacterium]